MKPAARKDEISRIGRRLRNADQFLEALELAISEFGDDRLSGDEWEDAFSSGDPDGINRTGAVMNDYEHIVQDVVEAGKGALRVTDHVDRRRPRADEVIDQLAELGALSKRAAERLHDHCTFRGRVSHSSPDVSADELADYAERALQEVPGMLKGLRDWLASEGVTFTS